MKKLELLAATALTLFVAAPAMAQEAAPPADATSAESPEDESANDIIVTATRRNETVQEVPIAITAVSNELLENAGVQDIRGLEQLAPSLQTTTGQSAATGASLSIRGIGTAGDNPGFEPAVGVFIDGVFRPRAGVALSELPELERVEILRGPQGTLFGRNTSAGALSIFTALPKFDGIGGYIEGSYGNYNAYEIEGAITGPVSEQVALRVDGGYRKRDGYIKDANSDRRLNEIDRYNVRAQALIDTGDITFRLIGDYAETDEACCGVVNVQRGQTAPAIQAIAQAQGRVGIYTGPGSDRIMAVSPNRGYSEQVRDWGVSGELNWDFGDISMTSITAYRKWRATRDQDIDFSGIDRAYRDDYRTELRDFTQELRFQGSAFGGKLDWLVGGFYLNEELKLRDTVRIGADGNRYLDTLLNGATRSALLPTGAQFYGSLGSTVPLFGQVLLAQNPIVAPPPAAGQPPVRLLNIAPPGSPLFTYLNTPLTGNPSGSGNNDDLFRVRTNAFALFTHNIINITDQVSLTLGARWNHESKKLDATINSVTPACGFFTSTDPRAATYRALIQGANAALYQNLFLLSCNPAVNSQFNGSYEDDRTEDKITGTVKLAFKASDQLLVYGSYDRGYKSGGYNLDQASFDSVTLGGNGPQATDLAFGPETVDSYEVGVKFSPNRAFTFNIAGFYGKYRDLQNLVFSGNNFVVQNIESSTSKGVEAEAIIRPSRDLSFRFGYTLLDAKYDESNNFTGPLAGLEGRQIQNQPRHVINSTMTWEPRISENLNGLLHVDMRYNSVVEIVGINGDRGIVRNQGYPLIGARVGLGSADGNIRGEFFVENLTNQFYYISGFAIPEQTGTFGGYPGYPRFYGVRARFGF
jgi:iron complex outermembrane receptor protein